MKALSITHILLSCPTTKLCISPPIHLKGIFSFSFRFKASTTALAYSSTLRAIVQHGLGSDQKKINKRENLHGFWLFSSIHRRLVGSEFLWKFFALERRQKARNKKGSKSTPFSLKETQVGMSFTELQESKSDA